MNPPTLPDPANRGLWLVVAPHGGTETLLELAARLALHGSLRVLDGGNRFNAHICSRSIARLLVAGRWRGPHPGMLEDCLARIQIARAFTCFQMAALLGETPPVPLPTLVLDLLATFYDESVPTGEARRLLEACIPVLQTLSQTAPVIVGARRPPGGSEVPGRLSERGSFVERLAEAADRVWLTSGPTPVPALQLSFFQDRNTS